MERTKMTLKDLAVSFHFPKSSTSRDFHRAFGCRVCMSLSHQMISVYQLYIVEDYVHQTKTEAAGIITTMSIITMVVSLTASLVSDPISDKTHTHKISVIIASLLFAIGTAMSWIMPSITGMYLYAGTVGSGYDVYLAIDQTLNAGVLSNKGEAGKGLDILNLATTLGQAVGPTIISVVKTTIGTYTPAFVISIVMTVCAAVFVLRVQKVK